MPVAHTVVQGESVASLADKYGLTPKKIWDDPANEALRELRGDGNILHPGDVIIIPDREPRLEKRPTGALHTFQVLNTPALLRLQLYDGHSLRAEQVYRFVVDDAKEKLGITDANGVLEEKVNPQATGATILIGRDNQKIRVLFGHLDPVNEITGIQQRLSNLGFPSGPRVAEETPELRLAITRFQIDHGVKPTGTVDSALRELLEKIHDKPYSYPKPV